MSHTLTVQWTIEPEIAPRPLLSCSRCRGYRPFIDSGKTRLNANGRRLDAWLIYRCADCDDTWNRPIFERKSVGDIPPATLAALQGNDPAYIREVAFDVEDLRRRAGRIEEFSQCRVERHLLAGSPDGCTRIEIVLASPMATCMRVDRLLSTELALSRGRLAQLEADGRLALLPLSRTSLRRPIKDGMRIVLDISAEENRREIAAYALGVLLPT